MEKEYVNFLSVLGFMVMCAQRQEAHSRVLFTTFKTASDIFICGIRHKKRLFFSGRLSGELDVTLLSVLQLRNEH